jgi:hypothetical protein
MKNILIIIIISFIANVNVYSQEQATISGKLEATLSNINPSLFTVILKDVTDGSEQTKELDSALKYSFTVNKSHDYSLIMALDSTSELFGHVNGVSTLDLVLIQRDLIGIAPFNNPFIKAAADVSLDGKVTVFDLILIRRLILGIDTQYSHGQSSKILGRYSFTETIDIINLQSDSSDNDFIVVKLGDVNGTATGG